MTRLKLRDDAYYAPTSEGICILTNSGEVVLAGPSIFQWIDRLAPYLDGGHTLAELTASMPPARRDMTERIITTLRERGVVVNAGENEEKAGDDSAAVLVGAGRMLVETVEAALCSGSRLLRVAVTGECPTDVAVLAECGRRARQRGPLQEITQIAADLAGDEQLSHVVAGADIVVYVSDHASAERACALDRVCARGGARFVAAIPAGGHAWLGPFGPATPGGPGWMSAWRRLLALDATDAEPFRPNGPGGEVPATQNGGLWATAVPTMLANQVMRQAERQLGGTAERAGQPRMLRVGLRSLRTESHRFLPHPFSLPASRPGETGLLATVSRLRGGEPLDTEEFSRRVTACLQPRLGVLGEVTEQDFTQLPLAVSQVQVSDPVRLLGPGVPLPAVIGAAPSLAGARRAAVLRGLAAYGSLMVDPRRLHVRGDASDVTGDPEEDLAALTAGKWRGFVWGYGLADGLPHPVPAEAAFPALRGIRSRYAPPAGAAAGYDWQQAVRTGLAGRCRRLALTEVAAGQRLFSPVEWNGAALDEAGGRCLSMVQATAGSLDVYDVTGAPGVPTLAFCLDGAAVAYASGFSFTDALRDGLAEVLLAYQAQASHEPGYAPPAVPPVPVRGRVPRAAACPAWSTDEATVAARLAQLGWTAVAVPLDHDPGVTASIMPYLVNVVLTRG